MLLRRLLGLGVMLVGVTGAGAGCRDVQVFTRDKEDPKRPIGDACTVDAECNTGRCVAGICQDGGCQNDQDCRADEICVFQVCEPVDQFACQPDQAPLLSIQPGLAIDFGQVPLGGVGEEVVTVENVGDCLLTLSSAGLDDQGDPGFGCEPCDPTVYPQRVPPNQSLDIIVRYSPQIAGEAASTLLIRSDDTTAGDDGLVSVALSAAYDGIPSMVIEPVELNFGFVAQGSTRTLDLQITNRGTGNAALVIDQLFVNNSLNFTIPPEVNANQANPIIVPPYDPNNPDATLIVPVTFAPGSGPGSLADFFANLVVHANDGTAAGVTVPVPMTASSLGPPQINVSTDELIYKCGVGTAVADVCPTNEAYPVGVVAFRTVTINNSGQSALNVNLTLGGEAGDFTVSPTFIPPIPAGGSVPVSVFFNPSAPSDPANRLNPVEPFDAVLNITSDDTDPATDVLKTVVLKGFAKGGQSDQVLKLEMEYQNADNSWAGNDFRDVDLELESPTGFSCTKPIRQFASDGNGGFIVTGEEDLCEEWNAFGQEGQTSWIALGQYEEPERILLFGLGPTGAEGGTFTARVYYIEDCANIPTGLLADILGIGGSILLGILGGQVGVPIAVPPDQISDLVANNCFDHEGSTVTLHITLDGTEVAAPQHRLGGKGDVFEIAHLKRQDGQFCDPQIGLPCP